MTRRKSYPRNQRKSGNNGSGRTLEVGQSFSLKINTQQEQTERTEKKLSVSLCFLLMESFRLLDAAFFQFLRQESIGQRGHIGGLFVVRCAAVAAFDILVVKNVVALLFHPGD